jgi:hypothetical protein
MQPTSSSNFVFLLVFIINGTAYKPISYHHQTNKCGVLCWRQMRWQVLSCYQPHKAHYNQRLWSDSSFPPCCHHHRVWLRCYSLAPFLFYSNRPYCLTLGIGLPSPTQTGRCCKKKSRVSHSSCQVLLMRKADYTQPGFFLGCAIRNAAR